MGYKEFEGSGDAPEARNDVAEEQLAISGEPEVAAKKRKPNRNQEWGREIVANGYLMILYH